MVRSHVLIISPALANANNGNWQTARRWRAFLRDDYQVDCALAWLQPNAAQAGMTAANAPGASSPVPDVMIALHARRSAASIAGFAKRYPTRPLILVLTGTDLYRDIAHDPAAQQSLSLASHLVVLQEAGLDELSASLHAKTRVIYQSAPSPARLARQGARQFRVIMIGHLRPEKAPEIFMEAAARVQTPRVKMLQVGAALDPALGQAAARTALATPRYSWAGALPHAATLQRLRRSDLMVISSRMEGGANVIIEAVTCGVPVLASDIPGNRGMLGADYAGYFPLGDASALAGAIDRAASDPVFLALLRDQCAARAALFAPARERAAVRELVDNLVLDHLQGKPS